ncbi:hypothetical protein [Methylobacterium sp. NEAU K]|uniref:hypothetical protein n=1 Tax=Methylobacterium sp. NEAU K TaxID=3064946 RepID=UPI002735EF9B|nr:hypothetical protein [Methylobacterium sp. NEAU K]MDP4005096.1 hypothetical protein [Methylobacterium sp. NEAU K]
MTENDATLIKRMAGDMAQIAYGLKAITDTVPALAARVAALEAVHGTNVQADTTSIADILSTIEGAAPAVAAAAVSTAATAEAAAQASGIQQAPAEQQSAV